MVSFWRSTADDEGLAVGAVGGADEIGLASRCRNMAWPRLSRSALAHEIDLHRRVDRMQVVVPAREEGIVGEIDRCISSAGLRFMNW